MRLTGLRKYLVVLFSGGVMLTLLVGSASAASFQVVNLDDAGPGSLRQAIIDANGTPGADTITFDLSGTITLGSQLPNITDALTVDGSSESITISGNDLYRIFRVNTGVSFTLQSLTLAHADAGRDEVALGGGIRNAGGTVVVNDSTFSDNWGIHGGAIANEGTLTITNSTFSGNNTRQLCRLLSTYDTWKRWRDLERWNSHCHQQPALRK